MALVFSTDVEEVNVRALGNWFTFKPGQIKSMDDKLAHFICTVKAEDGFIGLPDICLEAPDSPESKAIKAEAIKNGRNNIIKKLQGVVRNLEVHMQRDIDVAGMKMNSTGLASDGELKAYRRLAAFKALDTDEQGAKIAEIAKIKEQLNGGPLKSST